MDDFLYQASIYLAAAVIAVPLSARLGLGSVLGYLAAGIIIGPILGLVGAETEDLQHVAEFGVVMMLFLIGLELEPRALWDMRDRLLGLGGLQVLLSTAVIAGVAFYANHPWSVALAVGLTLSLSSTAIVLQTLSEKGLMQTNGGRATFSVLLTQDIAVIPILAMLPLLALPAIPHIEADGSIDRGAEHLHDAGHHSLSLVEGLPGWAVTLGDVRRHRFCHSGRRLPDAPPVPFHPRHPPARDVYGAGADDRGGHFLPDDPCWPVPRSGCLSGGRCAGQLGIPARDGKRP